MAIDEPNRFSVDLIAFLKGLHMFMRVESLGSSYVLHGFREAADFLGHFVTHLRQNAELFFIFYHSLFRVIVIERKQFLPFESGVLSLKY